MESATESLRHAEHRVQIVTGERRLFDFDFREIWQYRALIPLLIRRDFRSEFSQTLLGPFWFVAHPLMQSVIFAMIFGNLAKISTDGAAPFLFYNCGLVLWTYFTLSTTYVSNVFVNNAGLFGKVYFPRMIIPMAIVGFRLINFVVNFVLLLGFIVLYYFRGVPIEINWWALATPLLLAQTIVLALGVGTLTSCLNARYRDLMQAIAYFFAVWMYATPIIYPLSAVPPRWHWLFAINPLTSIVEVFRHGWLGAGTVPLKIWAINIVTTVFMFFVGVTAFSYTDKTVVDTA
jgi:lipopolysaccharide transport system permease protein